MISALRDPKTWDTVGFYIIITIIVLFMVGIIIPDVKVKVFRQLNNSSSKEKFKLKWTTPMTIGAALVAPMAYGHCGGSRLARLFHAGRLIRGQQWRNCHQLALHGPC